MMADSVNNNTRHGGVDHGRSGDSTGPPMLQGGGILSDVPSSSSSSRQTTTTGHGHGPVHNLLHSPAYLVESGYNTDSSPVTTNSAQGTPCLVFDFDDLPQQHQQNMADSNLNSVAHQPRPTPLPTQISETSVENDSDDYESSSWRSSFRRQDSSSSHSHHRRHDGVDRLVAGNAPANLLGLSGSSRAMSRSFQGGINLHGVSGSEEDDDDETEKDDELTSSEERYLQESHRSQTRRCSLRRRNFGDEPEAASLAGLGDSNSSQSWPMPTFRVWRQESHDSQSHSDSNSPMAPCPMSSDFVINSVLHEFLGQDITPTSIGLSDNRGEPRRGEELQALDLEQEMMPREVDEVQFRLSLNSDDEEEEGIEENALGEDDGQVDDDDVFTFDEKSIQAHAHSPPTPPSFGGAFARREEMPFTMYSNTTSTSSNLPRGLRNSPKNVSPINSNIVVAEKPPISPSSVLSSSVGRRRTILSSSVNRRLQLSGGASITHNFEMSRSLTVGTQTPHVTSVMIQEVMNTPVPLPNEARGSAASRLRRLSESGAQLPPSPAPLPDIVPFLRDRSSSAPDIQAVARRQAIRNGRLVGRELRRMSDEFNSRRNLFSPSNNVIPDQASSLPGTIFSYMREAFRSRRGSSVDYDEDADSNEGS